MRHLFLGCVLPIVLSGAVGMILDVWLHVGGNALLWGAYVMPLVIPLAIYTALEALRS